MKNICIIFLLLQTCTPSFAQDKVILLNGDTVNVMIPADPKKETDLSNKAIGSINDYGFKTVIAIYNKDSIRIHSPSQIKGYLREKNGTYLGSGYFESRVINERQIGYKYENIRSVFLQRVNFHKDITIWYYREDLGNALPQSYFLIEIKQVPYTSMITTYRQWAKWSVNYPPLDELTFKKTKPKNGKKSVGNLFQYLVELIDEYKSKYP